MEENWTKRTELLFGKEKLAKLQHSHLCIFGLGGVGGYVAEQLCRAGIGEFTLVDGDEVNSSNINRQIIATTVTLGTKKTDASAEVSCTASSTLSNTGTPSTVTPPLPGVTPATTLVP